MNRTQHIASDIITREISVVPTNEHNYQVVNSSIPEIPNGANISKQVLEGYIHRGISCQILNESNSQQHSAKLLFG